MKRRNVLGGGVAASVMATGRLLPPAAPIGPQMDMAAEAQSFGGYAPEVPKTIDMMSHLQGEVLKRTALRTLGLEGAAREMLQFRNEGLDEYDDGFESLRSVSPAIKKLWRRERYQQTRFQYWFDQPAQRLKMELLRQQLRAAGIEL